MDNFPKADPGERADPSFGGHPGWRHAVRVLAARYPGLRAPAALLRDRDWRKGWGIASDPSPNAQGETPAAAKRMIVLQAPPAADAGQPPRADAPAAAVAPAKPRDVGERPDPGDDAPAAAAASAEPRDVGERPDPRAVAPAAAVAPAEPRDVGERPARQALSLELPPALESYVHAKVMGGRYTSANEVVRDALRLMEDRDHLISTHKNRVWKQIADGLEILCDAPATERENVLDAVEDQLDRLEARLNQAAGGIDCLTYEPEAPPPATNAQAANAQAGDARVEGDAPPGPRAARDLAPANDRAPMRLARDEAPNDSSLFEWPAAWDIRPAGEATLPLAAEGTKAGEGPDPTPPATARLRADAMVIRA